MAEIKKILIIRLSSIGDIVLTTPVVRSVKKAFPEAEVHFLTKGQYGPLLEHNPYIDQLYLFQGSILKMIPELDAERYDFILDLHNNMRTAQFKMLLGASASTFDKINGKKFLMTKFKVDKLPRVHIVERYADAAKPLGVELDDEGLDFFLPEEAEWEGAEIVQKHFSEVKPVAIVLGGQQGTKKWPTEYFIELLQKLNQPVVLLGGKTEIEAAAQIEQALTVPLYNAVAQHGLLTSAGIMKACAYVIAHDTGFMHIAAAFQLKIFSLWGNTIPELGMYPYRTESIQLETKGLKCRPCSKLGYKTCPQSHFKCMRDLTPDLVLKAIHANS